MSPDRESITRAESVRRRREQETQQRTIQTPARLKSASTPVASTRSPATMNTRTMRQRYDSVSAVSMPRNRGVQAPSVALPQIGYGPRLLSFLIVAACLFVLYAMFNSDPFIIRSVSLQGNVRIPAQEIVMVLGLTNQPGVLTNPGQIEYNVISRYPEISSVQTNIEFPARIDIIVQERQPVLAWKQDERVLWVDASGYAFPPRGEIAELITVSATGSPPLPAGNENQPPYGARLFLKTELAQAIAALAPMVPEGASLIYDPQYGLGWSDPRGWQAYFGKDNNSMSMKLQIYQNMVDHLLEQDILPSLISVEYPNAPFYRLSEQ